MPSVSREGTRPLDRESSWLKMTGEWIKLAQNAEAANEKWAHPN
jgi:hypothetical protein